jgi:hypothetical protein
MPVMPCLCKMVMRYPRVNAHGHVCKALSANEISAGFDVHDGHECGSKP